MRFARLTVLATLALALLAAPLAAEAQLTFSGSCQAICG
jgi:hypothetical protein